MPAGPRNDQGHRPDPVWCGRMALSRDASAGMSPPLWPYIHCAKLDIQYEVGAAIDSDASAAGKSSSFSMPPPNLPLHSLPHLPCRSTATRSA
eukprot:366572-Chlamydomonas_euryale.AAC.11